MTEMIITRGLPRSGKSTYARSWVAQSPKTRAHFRRAFFEPMAGGNVELAEEMKTAAINTAITAGMDIIVSDNHTSSSDIRTIVAHGLRAGYTVSIVDIKENLDVLIKRDKASANPLGESAIRKEWKRHGGGKRWPESSEIITRESSRADVGYAPYRNDIKLPSAILVDVDGTVAINPGTRDFRDYSEAVLKDEPNWPVIQAVNSARASGVKIIIMSGRMDKCATHTVNWLNTHGVGFDEMYMRPTGDERPDWIIKDEMVRAHIENRFHIVYCLDDRNQVVDHHRAMGYTVFQVAPGNF